MPRASCTHSTMTWSHHDEFNLVDSLKHRASDDAPETDEGFWEDHADDEIDTAFEKAVEVIDSEAARYPNPEHSAKQRAILVRQHAHDIAVAHFEKATPQDVARFMQRLID